MSDIDIANIKRMDGGLLLVFRELLRCSNASETARRLHLSQSAVSHALGRLRDIYDDPLFVRRPRGLAPTTRAIALGPQIEALVGDLQATMSSEQGFNPARSARRFVIGASEFVTAIIGAHLVQHLQEISPRIALDFRQLSHETTLDLLTRGELDLAVGRFGRLERRGLEAETLFEDEYCVVARRGHPRIAGTIDQATYRSVGHIYSGSPSEGDPWERLPAPERVRMAAIVSTWLTAFVIVASSDAITTCPRRLAEKHARVHELQVLDLPFRLPPFSVSILKRAGEHDPGTDWLVQHMCQTESAGD